MDTVGVAGMERPFEPDVENGRLHGRGSYDMKAGLAAIMLAGADAAGAGLRGDVIVTAVADEEVASSADRRALRRPRRHRLGAHRDAPGARAQGLRRLRDRDEGPGGARLRPDLGIDAIAHMGHVLVGIEALDRRLRADPTHPLLGSGSLHASVIEGGQEFSSYPERCLLKGERRTIPGESTEHVEGELRELLGDIDGEIRVVVARQPFETPADEAIAELVSRHAGGPEIVGVPFWADSALLSSAGIPTVVFGPAGEGAHAVEEWVDLASVERCVEIYSAVARGAAPDPKGTPVPGTGTRRARARWRAPRGSDSRRPLPPLETLVSLC